MMRRYRFLAAIICAITVWLFAGVGVYAAEANISFGSDSYDAAVDDILTVGVSINSDGAMSEYRVLLRYDADRLEYLTGADTADRDHGILSLEKSGLSVDSVKYWLQFRPVSGGTAEVKVTDAVITGADGSQIGVPDRRNVSITIEGEDSVSTAATANGEEGNASPQEAAVENTGEVSMVDGESGGANAGISRLLGSLANGENSGADSGSEIDDYYASFADDGLDSDSDGSGVDEEDDKPAWYKALMLNPIVIVLIITAVVFIVLETLLILFLRKRGAEKRRKDRLEEITKRSEERQKIASGELSLADAEYVSKDNAPSVVGSISDIDENKYPIIDFATEERLRAERGEPVISVQDVTMEYKLYQNQASGLKEYLIQVIKQEVTYKRLFALYHVSFDVFKGEVVGIIGTNGSGKSTILKIVSGALDPTDGEVDCDRSKLQILTLGTGFDMELTGRENIYLNGAIIGYTREFIDEHFDEIVAFAELGDFMDEKVKNYSSGMVSRLGFAIATAGDAAEILILDEVLSVGDQFFQKKSLARIKEMIHGGSTVLMVSHGMNTILEHCTKVVWIEKGQLRMIGKPEEVCAEYKKLEQ